MLYRYLEGRHNYGRMARVREGKVAGKFRKLSDQMSDKFWSQVVAHGQKDITSLVSLVRIKVFEVDGAGGGGGGVRGEGGGKGRREVENRKLVQLVSILTNQIFRSILDTRADLRERKAELVARAKAAEEKTVASYGTRGEGELCEREVGSRIREF